MGKLKKTIRVLEIEGEAMRYRVESWDRPQFPHMVDLVEEAGHGACDCKDFQTTIARNRKAQPGQWQFYGNADAINPLRTQCKHIAAAQRKFLMTVLPGIAAKQPTP